MEKPKLSLIIPAYNEEKRIGDTLEIFSRHFRKSGLSYEIVVVLDGCMDRTAEIVKKAAIRDGNILCKDLPKNMGKGGALLEGFLMARGEYVAYTDADGSTRPEEIERLLGAVGVFDGVIGSRWMKGSVVSTKQPLQRRIASRAFNMLTRIILGLPYKDTQCPAKVMRREVAESIAKNLHVKNFAFDAGMLYVAKRMGFRLKEIPIEWNDKELSSLKMSRAVPHMLYAVIKLRTRGH